MTDAAAADPAAPLLFQPLTLRGVTLRNRVMVAPMCQYVAEQGVPTDWHFVHLGRFAIGGAGVVMVEATAVEAEGRITHGDVGLWNDAQQQALARIAAFISSQGATPAIQLAHAGRKASTERPFDGGQPVTADAGDPEEQPWTAVAPSAVPFTEGWPTPAALSENDLQRLKGAFAAAARRALAAGFDIVEVHAAHGYLLTEFLSPVSNRRTDAYGGDRAGRMRFPLEVVEAVRAVWPEDKPLFVRISAVDGAEGGWGLEDSVAFARELKARGVDVIDTSSGGLTPQLVGIDPRRPGYQTGFAERVRAEAGIATAAVGLIFDPQQAERILQSGQADLVALAREMLDNPNWAQSAKAALAPDTVGDEAWPKPVGYAVRSLHKVKAAAAA